MARQKRPGVMLEEVAVVIFAVVLVVGAGWAYVTISAPVSTTSVSSAQSSGSASSSATSAGSSGSASSGSATGAGTSTSGSGGSAGATVTLPQGAGSGANFSPTTLSVAPGTTITFVDQDSVAKHNVDFSSGPSGATLPSASPNLVKGSTFQVTLTTAGTYDYHCDYHSWMVATITVT